MRNAIRSLPSWPRIECALSFFRNASSSFAVGVVTSMWLFTEEGAVAKTLGDGGALPRVGVPLSTLRRREAAVLCTRSLHERKVDEPLGMRSSKHQMLEGFNATDVTRTSRPCAER